MKKILLAFSIFLLPMFSFSQIDNEAQGLSFISHLFAKEYKDAYAMFDENMKANVSEAMLGQLVDGMEKQLGAFKEVLSTRKEESAEIQTYYYFSRFDKDELDIKISFNKENKIAGFYFAPHTIVDRPQLNDYSFVSDGLSLPGTLLIPEKDNKNILAIFIHGSGPNDRDETVGKNKPFKDIAEGLLPYGIASYRFDKRTLVNPASLDREHFTVKDEVTNDIINLVHHFHTNDTFKDYKIILIGHSLGAMMLPEIINKTKEEISGAIMMSGNARPLQDLIVEQYEYIKQLQPSPQMDSAIIVLKEQVKYLNSNQFNIHSPDEKLPLHLPASYWQSLKNYNQVSEAKRITIPLLITQGERDYQVTMEDFNLWKKNLEKNKNVSFKSYPDLNHLMMTGKGKSTPDEYNTPHHVPDYFIKDIANWILALKK